MQINEINATGNRLCSECWSKLEAFHEFYHMVEVTHRSQLKNKGIKFEVQPTQSGSGSTNSVADGKNRNTGVQRPSTVPNKSEILSKLNKINQSFTVKKKVLKLNCNSRQSKEVNLHIEKRGINVRCNIFQSNETGAKTVQAVDGSVASTAGAVGNSCSNGTNVAIKTETDSESESECANVQNIPTQEVKMEEELIISDEDDNDDSHAHNEKSHQSDEMCDDGNDDDDDGKTTTCNICQKTMVKSHIGNHQAKLHNICKYCNRIYPSAVELTMHLLRCNNARKAKNILCDLCNKNFKGIFFYKRHMQQVHEPNYQAPKNTDHIRTANEAVFKKWASLITHK